MLYRHCLTIQKQLDQAMLDIRGAGEALSGSVTVSLAPLGLGAALAPALLAAVHERHPGIVLHVNESVGGGSISEQIMAGKTDMALIFNPGAIPGTILDPVHSEELHLLTARSFGDGDAEETGLEEAVTEPLILPGRIHTVRQVIDTALGRLGVQPDIVAQTESPAVLAGALAQGLGGTILPRSATLPFLRRMPELRSYRIRKPSMTVHMAICTPANLPLSEPAEAVRALMTDLAREEAMSQ